VSQVKQWIIHVSANGSDSNTGKQGSPFHSLERARDEIRIMKKKFGYIPEGGVIVEIEGRGPFFREKPFELTAEDSGTEASPIVYRAKAGSSVLLLGGKIINHWKSVTDQTILNRLDVVARGKVLQADLRFSGIKNLGQINEDRLQLFFQGQPMTLARWPNDGFVKIKGLVEPGTADIRGHKGSKTGKFIYEGNRPNRWVSEKEAWVHGYWFWDWADQRHRIADIDTINRIIAVKPPYHSYGYRIGQWFYALNLLSELDRPGEWYLDRETSMIYFWPPTPIESGTSIVSLATNMIVLKEVSNITLQEIAIEAIRDTAIRISGGTNCKIDSCIIRNIGGSAIDINGGSEHKVVGCTLSNLGEGAVVLHGGNRETLQPANHVAENNHIHHYGLWKRMYSPAISISGVGNRLAHNHIHDGPHQAVAFSGNDHLIEFNDIHDVCLESNDAGAIYAGRDWTMRGTIIRHNYLHRINGFEGRGAIGIYLDDMFCGTEVFGNIFYKVTNAVVIGGGRDSNIENNIFFDCNLAIHVDARALTSEWWQKRAGEWIIEAKEKTTLFGIRFNQPPYSIRYPKLINILAEEPTAPRGNKVARNISVGGKWAQIKDKARPYVMMEDNLIDQAPLFSEGRLISSDDMRAIDFRLRYDSPAWKLGFKPIPVSQIGIYRFN